MESHPTDLCTICGLDIHGEDEKHVAIALFLLHKAIASMASLDQEPSLIHQCLRDASMHCEEARKSWTKEAVAQRGKVLGLVFGRETILPNGEIVIGTCDACGAHGKMRVCDLGLTCVGECAKRRKDDEKAPMKTCDMLGQGSISKVGGLD